MGRLVNLFQRRLSESYNQMLTTMTGVRLSSDIGAITVHKELTVAHVPSLWIFIQRILDGFSESGRVGNASCATFSVWRVEGEAWVGEFYGASQLFWFWVVNILPRREYLAHGVCRNSFAALFPLEAPAVRIPWDHSTDREGKYWGLKFPLIWETCRRSLIWLSFKWCNCPSKPLKEKESWCECSLSQAIPGTVVWVCCSFPSPPRLFSLGLPQSEQV